MRYDIVKIEDATQDQIDTNPREHNGYYLVRNENGERDANYVRGFVNSLLLYEQYELAIKYGDYHDFDDNRAKSGQWMAAMIIGRTLYSRDIGDINETEKVEIETIFLQLLNLLAAGHWKTAQLLGNQAIPSLSSQKLKDMVQPIVDSLDAYILEFYT
jgi:hypothetical protein